MVQKTIVVTGSLGYDYIMNFPGKIQDRIMPDKLHAISLSLLADKLNRQFGGTAGNIAYSLKLLGIEPLIQTYAGNDFLPYKQFLHKHHIPTTFIACDKTRASGTYFVVTDQDDNQIGAYYKGAMVNTPLLSLRNIHHPFSLVVVSPSEPRSMEQYVKECIQKHIPYLYDPAFQIGNFSKSALQEGVCHAAIVIGNDYEIALLEKKLGWTHHQLLSKSAVVVTTLGAKGSTVEAKGNRFAIAPAKPKKIVDPTGAGDAYRAGFLAGFLRGFDLATCGQMGAVAALYTVEKDGTQTHMFTRRAFCARHKANYQKTIAI